LNSIAPTVLLPSIVTVRAAVSTVVKLAVSPASCGITGLRRPVEPVDQLPLASTAHLDTTARVPLMFRVTKPGFVVVSKLYVKAGLRVEHGRTG
jgi:hypothetical protein